MTRFRTIRLMVIGAALAASVACTGTSGRLYVRMGPPPVVVERRVAPPGPEYVWVGGFYRWTGIEYVWVGGRYERPPRPRAVWVPGRWVHGRRGWYFVDGRWR